MSTNIMICVVFKYFKFFKYRMHILYTLFSIIVQSVLFCNITTTFTTDASTTNIFQNTPLLSITKNTINTTITSTPINTLNPFSTSNTSISPTTNTPSIYTPVFPTDHPCELKIGMLLSHWLNSTPLDYNTEINFLFQSSWYINDLGDYHKCLEFEYADYLYLRVDMGGPVSIFLGLCTFNQCNKEYFLNARKSLQNIINELGVIINLDVLNINSTRKHMKEYKASSKVGLIISLVIIFLLITMSLVSFIFYECSKYSKMKRCSRNYREDIKEAEDINDVQDSTVDIEENNKKNNKNFHSTQQKSIKKPNNKSNTNNNNINNNKANSSENITNLLYNF